MKSFKVAIAYEEGIAFNIKAKTQEEAEEKALKIVEECGGAIRVVEAEEYGVEMETKHRDYCIA